MNNFDASSTTSPISDLEEALEGISSPPNKINILTIGTESTTNTSHVSTLRVVRVDDCEIAIIPFTSDGERVVIHYVDDLEFRGYLRCNGNNCRLCSIGRKAHEQILIPVFLPISREISILAVSTTMRPKSLLPQLQNLLQSNNRIVLFISRDRDAYTVYSRDLPSDVSDGKDLIANFVEAYKENRISLAEVYPLLSNDQLAHLPGISSMLSLKGLKA
jgi:hypothetical protein